MSGLLTTFVQLPTSASAPTPTGTARLWVKTSDGHVYFTDASNVDHDLTAGGGSTGNWVFSSNNATFPSSGQIVAISQGSTNTTGLTIQNNVADGASTIGLLLKNQTSITSGKWVSLNDAGTEHGYIKINGAAGIIINGDNASPFIRVSSASGTSINYGTANVQAATALINITDGTATVSLSGGVLTVPRPAITSQVVAAAASLTIAPASGDYVRINLSATAITSLTISAGTNGEEMVVEVVQDATGGRSIPSTWTNVAFAGGSYTATATANKHDCISFVYNSTLAKWVETGRSLNVS